MCQFLIQGISMSPLPHRPATSLFVLQISGGHAELLIELWILTSKFIILLSCDFRGCCAYLKKRNHICLCLKKNPFVFLRYSGLLVTSAAFRSFEWGRNDDETLHNKYSWLWLIGKLAPTRVTGIQKKPRFIEENWKCFRLVDGKKEEDGNETHWACPAICD